MQRARAFLGLAALLLLSGCATRATSRDAHVDNLMLKGHDPVAYFTLGKPTRGDPQLRAEHDGVTYYFASEQHRALFRADPVKYAPQYGGFCSNGAAYAVKLGSDPNWWKIIEGRLFIFGDVLGHDYFLMDTAANVAHGDRYWPEIKDVPWRRQTLKAWIWRVPHYKTGRELEAQWLAKGNAPHTFDPGGLVENLVKDPGWRYDAGRSF